MRKLSFVSGLLVSVLLVGCATAPKPELPDGQYAQVTRAWYAINQCGMTGNMSPDVAALGKSYVQANLAKYSFSQTRIESEGAALNRSQLLPTREQCNSYAMAILASKQQIELHNQAVDNSKKATQDIINSTRGVNTYCNKIAGQVFCNTY